MTENNEKYPTKEIDQHRPRHDFHRTLLAESHPSHGIKSRENKKGNKEQKKIYLCVHNHKNTSSTHFNISYILFNF
jgi:hypothetical protein